MCFLEFTPGKVRLGGTPQPARGTRALPGIFLAALLAIACADAAQPLTAEIKPLALRPRTSAPETIDVKFNWSGSGLLEGALELTFIGEGDGRPLWRSHDLALIGGSQSFRLLIPAVDQGQYGGPRDVRARFMTKTGALDLGRFDFGMQTGAERRFTICVAKPPFGGPAKNATLWQSLRIERLQPKDKTYKAFAAITLPVFVDAEEMPSTALGYTAFDLVLLDGDGFTLLREKHLAALKRWVLAGGSLCVCADDPVGESHRRFLAEILEADSRGIVPAFDAGGRLEVKGPDGVLLARPGFGRLVVTARGPQSDADAEAEGWRRATMYLWKMHGVGIDGAVPQEPWRWEPKDQEPWRRNQPPHYLSALLAPKHVRIMPVPVVLLVLGGFLLVIGPLDWLLLGRARLRRLTWITFPLTAVAFTGLTVYLAASFMGRNSQRSLLTVTDLGRDGRVLRETRFELIFPARSQEVTTEVRNALCAPVSYGENYYSDMKPIASGHYEGLFPARYTLRQSLTQWTPQLNRLTSLEAGEDASGLPWGQMHPRELHAANLHQRAVTSAGWMLYVMRGGKFDTISGEKEMSDFVHSICRSKETGWTRICTQSSPNGAADLADLALGATDDSEVLATIAGRREGEGIHIYRRLY